MRAINILIHLFNQPPTIITKYSSSGSTTQNHYVFTTENPHPKSLAAKVLLRNELMLLDEDFLKDGLAQWLEFREEYLKEVLAKEGDLVCKYCGKPHLEIGGRTPKDLILNNKNPNLATVDHIQALANDGDKYKKANLCVACKKCNWKKGHMPVDAFIEKIKK